MHEAAGGGRDARGLGRRGLRPRELHRVAGGQKRPQRPLLLPIERRPRLGGSQELLGGLFRGAQAELRLHVAAQDRRHRHVEPVQIRHEGAVALQLVERAQRHHGGRLGGHRPAGRHAPPPEDHRQHRRGRRQRGDAGQRGPPPAQRRPDRRAHLAQLRESLRIRRRRDGRIREHGAHLHRQRLGRQAGRLSSRRQPADHELGDRIVAGQERLEPVAAQVPGASVVHEGRRLRAELDLESAVCELLGIGQAHQHPFGSVHLDFDPDDLRRGDLQPLHPQAHGDRIAGVGALHLPRRSLACRPAAGRASAEQGHRDDRHERDVASRHGGGRRGAPPQAQAALLSRILKKRTSRSTQLASVRIGISSMPSSRSCRLSASRRWRALRS